MESQSLSNAKKQNFKAINSYFKKFDGKEGGFQICNTCYKGENLIICYICKQYYHVECQNLTEIPLINYICNSCDAAGKPGVLKPNQERKTIFDNKLQNTLSKKAHRKSQDYTNSTPANYSKSEEFLPDDVEFPSENIYSTNTKYNEKFFGHKRIIKHRRKRISNFEDEIRGDKPKNYLQNFDHTNINYKKRKIKVGDNFNIDVEDFYEKLQNNFTQDKTVFERSNLKKVWSSEKLSKDEIDEYLSTCKLFWNYRNQLLESDTCVDFYKMVKTFKRERIRLSTNQKASIGLKVRHLKEFVSYGVNLNNHFEEMCLKILNICNYSVKKAIFFIYKNINPFIDEEETGFKADITIFQREILSLFSDDESDLSV